MEIKLQDLLLPERHKQIYRVYKKNAALGLNIQLIQKKLSLQNTKSKFQNTKYKIKILCDGLQNVNMHTSCKYSN